MIAGNLAAAFAPLASGGGFSPPGPADFDLPGIAGTSVTKPMVMIVLSAVLIFAVTYAMSRKAELVPGRLQYAGEWAYGSVRNGIARDIIGTDHFMKFVPYLFTLFAFVLVNNYFGMIPFVQFPTFSHSGFAYGLAALSWLLYNGVGIWKHGALGYLKHTCVPSGVRGPVLLLIAPLEFLSNILVRPVTLALRLFANMFAGHLLLILFALGGEYLLFEAFSPINAVGGVLAWVMFFGVSALELLVMFLQAYVFTLLTAMYVSGAVADEH
ncbi:F0F1 ATP synthase subunit A [Nocardioides pantholopis]|uniref:F0F1 ATP synthase subunit A n=1 Tax=Nocardioides pantholopis TaxID=2483798 RepID=UPI00295F2439|nr:F0F1 ATP synthase subunit A [Nocardioides pantholopis]